MSKLTLFTGTSHPKLSKEVAKLLKIKLGKREVLRFDNSEVRVQILEDVDNKPVAIIQPTSNPTNHSLMQLFFFCDALKREGAKDITAVIPFFGYARQNIQHRKGEAVSAHVVIDILEHLGFSKIVTFDIHDEGLMGVFSVPFVHLSGLAVMAKQMKKDLKKVSKDTIAIVSPDQGGIERARIFGTHLFGSEDFDIVIVEKKRDKDRKHQSTALDIFGDVKGKTAILVDDMITSGGTLLHAADMCLNRGAAEVYAAISHHDFSTKAPERIQSSNLKAFYTTNTIPLRSSQKFSKLREISIASEIANALK